MATVVKNFRIKSGLIVEGTTATIGGQNILTETGGDAYILNLVGGATLVKSVGSNLSVDGAGELSLDLVGIVEDVAGTRLTTDGSTLNVDVDGIADDLTGSYNFATNSDVDFAVGGEATLRGLAIAAAVTDLESYADQAEADAITSSNSYTDGRETAITTAYQSYADTAEADAISAAAADATTKANAAQAAAEATASADATTKANAAQAAAELHADTAIANLVDSAPATLDTLNELAAALQDNPDIISDLQDIAAGKQDALTAGSNIDITGATISVTGLVAADISDFGSASQTANIGYYDPAGSAQTAEDNAKAYADGLAVNYDAAGSAAAAQTAAEAYADGLAVNYDAAGSAAAAQTAAEATAQAALDNVLDGTTPFTDLNINDVAKQVAARSTSLGSVPVTAYQFNKSSFKSGKFLVKIDNGTHNEISEILLTLDSSDNVAITEYAIVGTNGPRGTITATVDATHCQIVVTPVDDSTITVAGTVFSASEIVA